MSSISSASSLRHRKDDHEFKANANGHVDEVSSTSSATPQTRAESSLDSSTLNIIQIWAPMLMLIFGGCCSNVYTLESLIHTSPASGRLITAFQFLVTAIITLPRHVSLSRGWKNLYLKERSIPLTKWIIYTVLFLAVNSLNNMAFKYNISVPLHIILRSAGPVTTMIVGRLAAGRTYPLQKVIAVILLFTGVVLAALADTQAKKPDASFAVESTTGGATWSAFYEQAPGFALLAAALFIAAFLGLYVDSLYDAHGRSSNVISENIFYSHMLSLSFYASTLSSLKPGFLSLAASPPLSVTLVSAQPKGLASPFYDMLNYLPTALIMLVLNALTQYVCISGVNKLSARSSSLTVGILLNIRKLVSLLLSIWIFGNQLSPGVIVGAGLVFAGGGLYAIPTRKAKETKSNEETKKEL